MAGEDAERSRGTGGLRGARVGGPRSWHHTEEVLVGELGLSQQDDEGVV